MTWFAHTRVAPKQHTLIFLRVEVSIYRDTLKFQVERPLHLRLLTAERQTPDHSFLKTPPLSVRGHPYCRGTEIRTLNSVTCYWFSRPAPRPTTDSLYMMVFYFVQTHQQLTLSTAYGIRTRDLLREREACWANYTNAAYVQP